MLTAENRQVRPIVVKIHQRGRLLNAGAAPARPEVQQDHLAPIIRQVNRIRTIGNGEIGGYLADLGGPGAPVAAAQKQQGQRRQAHGKDRTGTQGMHIPIILSGRPRKKGGFVELWRRTRLQPESPDVARRTAWKPVLGLSDEPGDPLRSPGAVRHALRPAGARTADGADGDRPGPQRGGLPRRLPPVAGHPVRRRLRTGPRLGTDRGGRRLHRPHRRNRAQPSRA